MAVTLKYREAIAKSLMDAMKQDDKVLVLGAGVADPKGIFGTTLLAREKFPDRVIETPLSENMLTGACVGLGLEGWKPVFVHARMDFVPLTMEHLINTAAQWGFVSGHYPTMVIRCIVGRGWGQGPTHSQDFSSLLAHIPGLRVYIPYRPCDAYFALRHALGQQGPTIIVESRRLYETSGSIPDALGGLYWGTGYAQQYGPVDCERDRGITLVAFGDMLLDAQAAAEELGNAGIFVQVIDPQRLPLDVEFLLGGIERTGRLCVIDHSWATCGLTAEIIALAAEAGVLQCAPVRITPPFIQCPVATPLEAQWYPTKGSIVNACTRMLNITLPAKSGLKQEIGQPIFRGPF